MSRTFSPARHDATAGYLGGRIMAMNPGVSGIFALDLTPGNDVMTCNVPDPMCGKTHLPLGMIAGFSVK